MESQSQLRSHTIQHVELPITGSSELFPVHQVYCVGRNYADHAIEMGHDPEREPPFFFIKPPYAVLPEGGRLQYPSLTSDLHHEIELVVALGEGGSHLSIEAAERCIFGVGVGVDLTRRDVQAEAKEKRRPWEGGKVFLHSAPCSALRPLSEPWDDPTWTLELRVNGELRQAGKTDQMIWKVGETIAKLSELFPLYPGDLIFTGTPAGVGPISVGDTVHAVIDEVGTLELDVVGAG